MLEAQSLLGLRSRKSIAVLRAQGREAVLYGLNGIVGGVHWKMPIAQGLREKAMIHMRQTAHLPVADFTTAANTFAS